jgi:hypothetical protein
MRPRLLLTLFLGLTIAALAQDKVEFAAVSDVNVKMTIEREWIKNKTLKLTGYYPSKATMQQVDGVIAAQKIDKGTVKDIFYYVRSDGGHVMLLACVEKDGKPRSHCIAIDKNGSIVAYWIQTYPKSPQDWSPAFAGIATPKAEQAGAGQPATRPDSRPEGNKKPQTKTEGRSR